MRAVLHQRHNRQPKGMTCKCCAVRQQLLVLPVLVLEASYAVWMINLHGVAVSELHGATRVVSYTCCSSAATGSAQVRKVTQSFTAAQLYHYVVQQFLLLMHAGCALHAPLQLPAQLHCADFRSSGMMLACCCCCLPAGRALHAPLQLPAQLHAHSVTATQPFNHITIVLLSLLMHAGCALHAPLQLPAQLNCATFSSHRMMFVLLLPLLLLLRMAAGCALHAPLQLPAQLDAQSVTATQLYHHVKLYCCYPC
jgi:predicted small lipoprotein YifL